MTTAPTVPHRSRTPAVLGALAAVVALWLGLTAPSVSPVAPAPPPAVVDPAADPAPAGTTTPTVAPTDVPRIDGRGGRDGRR